MRVQLSGGFEFDELGVRLTSEGHRVVEKGQECDVVVCDASSWEKGCIGSAIWGQKANTTPRYAEALFFIEGEKPKRACGGWWMGKEWKLPFLVKDLSMGFMNGGVGPKVLGGMALEWTSEALSELKVFEKVLSESEYNGPIMWVEGRVIVGITQPLLSMLSELQVGKVGKVLFENEISLSDHFALGVRVSVLPFPVVFSPVRLDVDEGTGRHFWPSAGGGWVTARGKDQAEARRRVYKTISTLASTYPELMYRTDVWRMSGRPSSFHSPQSLPLVSHSSPSCPEPPEAASHSSSSLESEEAQSIQSSLPPSEPLASPC